MNIRFKLGFVLLALSATTCAWSQDNAIILDLLPDQIIRPD